MNKKCVVLCIALGIMSVVRSQNSPCLCQSVEGYNKWLNNNMVGYIYTNAVQGFKGERFYGEWRTGTVYLTSGDSITGVHLRYEKYQDELLFLNSEVKAGVLYKPEVRGFTLYDGTVGRHVFIRRALKLNPGDRADSHYLQLLQPGKLSFHVLRRSIINNTGNALQNSDKYYVLYNNQFYPLRLKRRDFVNLPFADKSTMKRVLQNVKLRVNTEEGMKSAVERYNSGANL